MANNAIKTNETDDENSTVTLTTAEHNAPVFVDANTVTHVAGKGKGNGSSIGTLGGIIIQVLEEIEEVAKLFGFTL